MLIEVSFFRLVRCNLYDEIKVRKAGTRPQRLESLFGLFSGRASGVVLPFMADSPTYTDPDFDEIRKACLDMTDFVFPSFDEQFIQASVSVYNMNLRENLVNTL